MVNIWKVHGSLDWFEDVDHQIIGVRGCRGTPDGFTPLMITPGIDKHRLAHLEPFRTIFGCSDAALEKARSYLCVGYGFNDQHLQTKLVERCEVDAVAIIVVTKNLSDTTKAFVRGGRCRKYLALEEGLRSLVRPKIIAPSRPSCSTARSSPRAAAAGSGVGRVANP